MTRRLDALIWLAGRSPRRAAWRRPSSRRSCALRSGVSRSMSTPARRATMPSMTCPVPWATAFMSIASVIDTPLNPSLVRSRSCITERDTVAGRARSPVTAGSATWPDMTILAPAEKALRNGISSRASRASIELSILARAKCGSMATAPKPGKCFGVATTPADWRPRVRAAAWRPTASGSEPNVRVPRLTLPGSTATSHTGA